MSHDDNSDPDLDRVQERSVERSHERAETVEDIVADVGELLGEQKYPTTAEELSVEYADETIDLPNETESLGDVFDRLVDERFESAAEAREAIVNQLTGEAGGPAEYNDQRPIEPLEESDAQE